MQDILITCVPDDVLDVHRSRARESGRSLEEYLRGRIVAHAQMLTELNTRERRHHAAVIVAEVDRASTEHGLHQRFRR